MTQINKGQARANEVHARNEQKFLEKHGHPRPGNGKKSQLSTGTSLGSTGNNTGTTASSGVASSVKSTPTGSSSVGSSPTGTQSVQSTGSTSSQNIARARPTGGSNDTVAYLEGAIDNVINVQDTYNKTYY